MDEILHLKHALLIVTTELIHDCQYCVEITDNPLSNTPIQCTKFSGSTQPISINVATCLTCGEYKGYKRS